MRPLARAGSTTDSGGPGEAPMSIQMPGRTVVAPRAARWPSSPMWDGGFLLTYVPSYPATHGRKGAAG